MFRAENQQPIVPEASRGDAPDVDRVFQVAESTGRSGRVGPLMTAIMLASRFFIFLLMFQAKDNRSGGSSTTSLASSIISYQYDKLSSLDLSTNSRLDTRSHARVSD